jgi:hypothetical protein
MLAGRHAILKRPPPLGHMTEYRQCNQGVAQTDLLLDKRGNSGEPIGTSVHEPLVRCRTRKPSPLEPFPGMAMSLHSRYRTLLRHPEYGGQQRRFR